MRCYHRTCMLSFNVVDRLTEDANTMLGQQVNKAGCIKEMLLDFIQANGIINDYCDIPKKLRLEKFFGFTGSGKSADTPQTGKKEPGVQKCRCQFDIYSIDRQTNDVLVMLRLHDNKSLLIRELYLDFVAANGIVKNYTEIPEKERLERFFGYVTKTGRQPDRIEGVHTDSGIITHAMPNGITIRINVEKTAK